jgi:hypothetical protein
MELNQWVLTKRFPGFVTKLGSQDLIVWLNKGEKNSNIIIPTKPNYLLPTIQL